MFFSFVLAGFFFPFIHLIHKKHVSLKSTFFLLLVGSIYFFLNIKWFLLVPFEELYGIKLSIEKLIAVVLLCLLAAFLYWVWFKLSRAFITYNYWKRAFFSSLLFALLEFIRSFAAAIFLKGASSYVFPSWSLGALGLQVINTPLLHLSILGGVYFLSFITMFILFSLYYVFTHKLRRSTLLGVLFFIIFLFVLTSQTFESSQDTLNFKIIQAPKERLSAYMGNLSGVDVLVLPENVGSKSGRLPVDIGVEKETLLIYSSYVSTQNSMVNRLYYRFNKTHEVYYDKTFLMPFGEYQPYIMGLVMDALPLDISSGNHKKTVSYGAYVIGASICGSILGQEEIRHLVREGNAQVIVNVASHDLFEHNEQYHKLNIAYARLRAVEQNRYVVQSAFKGPSFIISNKGAVEELFVGSGDAVLDSPVPMISQKTLYSVVGDFGIMGLMLLSLLVLYFMNWKTLTK